MRTHHMPTNEASKTKALREVHNPTCLCQNRNASSKLFKLPPLKRTKETESKKKEEYQIQ